MIEEKAQGILNKNTTGINVESTRTISGTPLNFEKTRHESLNETIEHALIFSTLNPKGIKESKNKIDYSEINWEFLDEIALRMNTNKHKYPKGNFRKIIDVKELEQSLFRHLRKMLSPKLMDNETYLEHLAAIGCNAQMIHEQLKNK